MARKRPAPRIVEVVRKQEITPNMLRITFGGNDLREFPDDQDSAYIKLRMTEPEEGSDERPVVRTYTVRHFDSLTHQLDVDFVLHEVDGLAADWARNCDIGDSIRIMGPGPKKLVDYSADWFLMIGDMSALPAISVNIEGLPDDAKGYALLEIISAADKQDIKSPDGFEIRWLENSKPEQSDGVLLNAVRKLSWLDGHASVWVAGEFTAALEIRKFLKEERNITRDQLYASSYWQIGQTEDGHRASKKAARTD